MSAFLLASTLCISQPAMNNLPGIDFTPLKAPLEKVAGSIERAMSRIENAPKEMIRFINIPAIVIAVLITILAMHSLQLHGLASSKTNRA